jgi:phosphonoacetaldehyde hydrolase
MCLEICRRFAVEPSACIKIGDTPSDIAEGRNAGMWTIGITRTGNMVGLSQSAWEALPVPQQHSLLEKAAADLLAHGAHAVAQSVAEAQPQIEAILARSERGELP